MTMAWGRWGSYGKSWGDTGGDSHGAKASGTKSYHNGGVEGGKFSDWYDRYLAKHYEDDEADGSGSGGTKGSGSGGSKGSGSGGSKGSGSGGSKRSGSGGSKGSGSGGSKGSGSGGSKGSGSGGSKGSGSGGSKGSGSGGSKGSGSGGSKGSGSGGSKGSGSGGSKGSGSGGSKGSGSGGSKGSGGTDCDHGGSSGGDGGKSSVSFTMGTDPQVDVSVTQDVNGQLFFNLTPTSFEGDLADIDGLFFNVNDDSTLDGLHFFPDENTLPVTGHEASANAVNALDNGFTVPAMYDGMVQFGTSADSTAGEVTTVNFTLWSDAGLALEDIDFSSMAMVIDSDGPNPQVLTGGVPAGAGASTGDSYHNGGVEGDGLDQWYEDNLSDHYCEDGSGSGGTKGSGTGGTKGSGSGGSKGSGSGGSKGSGSGGSNGSGSGGSKGSGSGGSRGSGSGGSKGSGSGGSKGSGSGGSKGSGSGGSKGS
ncbi:hypothetical protein A9Q94_19980, partial [Rhodobacterales bacterium 56_14_T64]